MSIKQQISVDIKDAMRSKDKTKVSVLRMILSELQYAQTSENSNTALDDKSALKVIGSYHKRLKKSLSDYPKGDKTQAIEYEMKVVEAYLPKKATEQETRKVVEEVLQHHEGAQFGVVMKAALAKLGDAADGALVSKVIKTVQNLPK